MNKNRKKKTKNNITTNEETNTMVFTEPQPQICTLLEEAEKSILEGFSHENFCFISRLLYKLRPHINKDELQVLEEMWRDSFTDSCDPNELNTYVSFLKARFE